MYTLKYNSTFAFERRFIGIFSYIYLTYLKMYGKVYTDMATLQKHISRGHAYWSIVESRRVNGKPRPIILLYLGRAEDILKRLTEGIETRVHSFSHGDVAALLKIAEELKIVQIINKHIPTGHRQLRDGFTIGASMLLAAVGRACCPTSKDNWYPGWARQTSLSYLLRMAIHKLDSQHFWDQMDVMPVDSIPLIEEELIKELIEHYGIELDTLLCDTSNFFTYISSTNKHCSIAQRGKNKQKRMDLRQFGLLLLVSRRDHVPLFHTLYQGNLSDRTIFKEQLGEMLKRFKALAGSLEDITIVFDQGNNSKGTLHEVNNKLYFVGALSPYHHKDLIQRANASFQKIAMEGKEIECYSERSNIWGLDLTVVVFISEKLRQGQLRGIEQSIKKFFKKLTTFQEKLGVPYSRGIHKPREYWENKISSMIDSHSHGNLILWHLEPKANGCHTFTFWIDQDALDALKQKLGRRIVITNRHQWSASEIIAAYYGQANVEYAFKSMKNPFHLAMRPQYHWTDQKIKVHGFICLLAFLLSMITYKKAKEKAHFTGSIHSLLEKLSSIRLATFIESPQQKRKGRYHASYRLEEMNEELTSLAEAMGISGNNLKSKIPFSVYI